MRNALLFLLAVAAGALSVSGEEDGDVELRRAIDALRRNLALRIEHDRAAPGPRLVRRWYDLAHLTFGVRDQVLRETNVIPSHYRPSEQEVDDGPYRIHTDQLIELIQTLAAPQSWDTVEGASIDPARHGLWIATVPRLHLRIRRLLDWIAESFSRQVAVDVVAVPARPEDVVHLATAGRPLAPKAAQELLARGPRGRARLVGSDVGRIVQLDGEELHYLGDYDVEISGRAKIGRPVTRRLFRGFAVEIRPCLADGTRGVVLHCRLQRTQVKRPLSKHETEHGDVELPEMILTRLNTSFWVPLGRTTIVGGTTTGEEPVLLLVTPHRLR